MATIGQEIKSAEPKPPEQHKDKPEVKVVIFIDLEKGPEHKGGEPDSDEDYDDSIKSTMCIANVGFFMLFYVFLVVTTVAFTNMPIKQAAGLTASLAFTFILLAIWIVKTRDKYISKDMAAKEAQIK